MPWVLPSRTDLLGFGLCGLVVVLFVAVALWRETSRRACFARTFEMQDAIQRSNDALKTASDKDEAGRCAVYRDRANLLAKERESGCVPYWSPTRDPFANLDLETRFYDRLIADKCS